MSNIKDFVIDNYGVLSEYVGNDSKVVIPTSVFEIGYKAFFNNSTIEEVIIPNTVEEIGVKAFCGCSNLKFVSLPTFYTKIQGLSFGNCTALTDVVITKVGDDLAEVKTRTKKLYEALKAKFPDKDFAQMHKLVRENKSTKTEVSTSISSVGSDSGITQQDEDLSNGNGAVDVTESTSVTTVEEIGEDLQIFLDEMDKRCNDLPENDDLNDDLNGGSIEMDFPNISSDEIPSFKRNITDIEISSIDVIRKMVKLSNISFKPELFSKNIMLFITQDMVEEYADILRYTDAYNDIAVVAFGGCDNLVNMQVPNITTSIGKFVFSNCSKLKIIQGKSELTSILSAAFKNCTELEFIRISNNAIIVDDAFMGCSKLDCNGNSINCKVVDEELSLQYISVYNTDRGPSHIRALKFYGKKIQPITDVINGLKNGTIKSNDVWLKEGTTLCIDDRLYKNLSQKFSYNKFAEGLFYYDNAGVGSNEKSMHACSTFRYGYSWYKNKDIAIVPLKYIDGCAVTSMDSLMSNITSGTAIETLDLTHFDTENVKNMFEMFARLKDVNKIIYGKSFVTSNVTSMSGMFKDCSSLSDVLVDNFKTSNVIDMSHMFSGCAGLSRVEVSGFNTEKVVNMTDMFAGCTTITDLPLNFFNTINVSNTRNMLPKPSGIIKSVGVPINQSTQQLKEFFSMNLEDEYNFIVPLM